MEQKEWMTCPKCGGDLDAFSFQEENGEVYRTVECMKCGFRWYEVFKFSHNEDPNSGKRLDEKGEEF